jgi:type I restriction enzyme S subunit
MRERWRSYGLGELCAMKYGRMPRPADLVAEGYPVFSGYRVVGSHKTYLYEQPQIVVVARGAGGCGEVRLSPPCAYITNLAIILEISSPQVEQRFLFYRLAHTTLRSLRIGAAQPQIVIADLRGYVVALPPLPDQRMIADTLTAYDELIANNTQRIATLAALARELYREWFVRYRFPGHTQAALVDSPLGAIPAGWEVQPFSRIAEFVNGYAFSARHWGSAGKPIVRIAELKHGISARTARYDGADIPARYHVQAGDILFSWSADLGVYIWAHGAALLNQHLFNVRPRAGYSRLLLFFALQERMAEFRGKSQGTTMRHITRCALDQVGLAVPPPEQRTRFDAQVAPLVEAMLNLNAQNVNLRDTRDLLAARLLKR